MLPKVPDVEVALERARITAKINQLTAVGTALLLQSVAATAPVEAKSLQEAATEYLNEADGMRASFASRFPKSLNLYHGGQ
jgi:hypothetical protein